MAKEVTVKGKMGRLQRLLARLNSNREELQHLEPSRVRFEAVIGQIAEAADRQAFHTAGKQEASQQLRTFIQEGERLATVLQLAVKHHYGIRSEKLVDFGLKPFRGLQRKARTEPQPPATPPATPPPASSEADRS